MQHSVPNYKQQVVNCRFISWAHQSFQWLLWAFAKASTWTHWESELLYSTLRPSTELDTPGLRSSPGFCNSKNVRCPNTCFFITVNSKTKVHPNISNLGSEYQNKLLACKHLRINHQIKGFDTNIMNFILFIRNQWKSIRKTQLTTKSLICFFGSEGPYFLWFWKVDISGRKRRAKGTEFCTAFSEVKVCIFLLKVLLYLLAIFWKIRIDTYITWRKYMRRTFKCICTDIDLHQKNFHFPNP